MDLVILNRCQMMSTTHKPTASSPLHITPEDGRLTLDVRFDKHQAYIHDGCLGDKVFEPGILQPRSRDLNTKPPWPLRHQ
ncbi:hypothetical protein AVEN_37707-1 [Araneus ventricosus]|uniref:Uncharacterized protein n=1 Tax=Araneus ventricosus TaxID=182803 RepID=A0A4Y2BSP8_ARAVE|nr:hypothetical protein AVEN_37707-1 [Araneus ventricosus]